jgi:hypothetical protein
MSGVLLSKSANGDYVNAGRSLAISGFIKKYNNMIL